MNSNGEKCMSDECEARDAVVDLLVAHAHYSRGEFLELPVRKLCVKCRELIEGLIKRRLTARIDL